MLRTYNTEGMSVKVTDEMRKLRMRSGYSMDKLAKALGYKAGSSYQRYEEEAKFKKPFLPTELIDKLLKVLPGLGDPPIQREEILSLSGLYKIVIKDVPEGLLLSGLQETLLTRGAPVITGDRIDMLGKSLGSPKDTYNYVSVGSEVSDEAFCLVVTDASMEPKFNIGDKLICDPKAEVRPGDYVIAKLDDEVAAAVRRYRVKGSENGQPVIDLVPLNADYPTVTIDAEHPGKIYARVVERRHKV